ncbi:hypothetical protein A9P82_02150 [Arachidicoccus ginsenosidimutans]|uniref:T9SS type A sorting domain-containing protein n=1 Tax=Arachidicoccus sp. BS20 TaxID=1850526 RepID=UPI0007F139F2|nr:T9SS type A sorting domain-containing protein [Arachidicoccus sp. BS20]ANI88215.1 hypothetical protein A9P82_02150 [Arachidicoccus sp. BS20]
MKHLSVLFFLAFSTINTSFAGSSNGIPSDIISSSSATVPLTLTSFSGSLSNGTVQLHWQTGIEAGLSYFEIEKSTDSKNYKKIAEISSKSKSNSDYIYSFIQTDSVEYYRLSLVGYDGTSTYSNIIPLMQKTAKRFYVYPNPATNYININLENASVLYIYSAGGILVQTATLPEGFNQVQLDKLSAGVYYATVGMQKIKFVKQ